jgi:hypothetical protein
MPMGIVSDKEFQSEIKDSTIKPISKSSVMITDVSRGRGEGSVEVPDSLRKVIGATALNDGRSEALELAKSFGISPSSVSAYTNGATSTASYDDTPNKSVINQGKVRLSGMAQRRLKMALRHITDDKLAGAKVRDIAGIAKDMAIVANQMEPEVSNNRNEQKNVSFQIFAPQFRDERKYETIVAKDDF